MLVDLHVHTRHSPGCTLAPADVVRRARDAGLDGVVVTDVNTLDALAEVRSAARESAFVALVGIELATDHGRFLCYFPDPEALPPPPQAFGPPPWAAREVLRFVASRGGVAVAAHPYDKTGERATGDHVFTLEGLSAIEGLCGRTRGPANDLAVEAADHLNLPCVAGSGAHASLDEIGKVATLFREPIVTESELVAQIRSGGVYCVAIGAKPHPPARRAEGRDRGGGRGGDERRRRR